MFKRRETIIFLTLTVGIITLNLLELNQLDVLSIEASNVKTRLNRAKTILRESLGGYMKEHVYNFHLTGCDRIVNKVFTHLNLL